jgi:hypothetical protein
MLSGKHEADMDPIESLSVVRNAIQDAISGLAEVDADNDLQEFARKEREYLKGVVAQIDADIRALPEADNAPRP